MSPTPFRMHLPSCRAGAASPGGSTRSAPRAWPPALQDAGLGPHSKVGMYLYNSPEYCETNFAAMKIRGVPVNVNYRYVDDELTYLLENADAEALVFHRSLGERVARVRERLPKLRLLVEVDDAAPSEDAQPVEGARGYDEIQATFDPARAHRAQGRRDLYALHGWNDGHAQGRDVLHERLHAFLPRGLPADGRAR